MMAELMTFFVLPRFAMVLNHQEKTTEKGWWPFLWILVPARTAGEWTFIQFSVSKNFLRHPPLGVSGIFGWGHRCWGKSRSGATEGFTQDFFLHQVRICVLR